MKILIFNWRDIKNPNSGGAEIVTMEHAKAWIRNGHTVVWFTSAFKDSKEEEIIDGVKFVRRGNSVTVYLFAPFFYFFSKQKYDLVIDEIHGIPFFTPLYVRKPKIAFIHEVAGSIWDYMYPFPINKIGKIIESFYFQFYKTIPFWTVSNSTKNDLEKIGIPQKNIHVIFNGINVKINRKLAKEKFPTFIFVSRIVKMKGIENVLEAFRVISRKEPKAMLWIVGSGETSYVENLKSKVENLKSQVIFWGIVQNEKKMQLLQQAHILLHASMKEGWGLVVVEAASQGTPSVVYNVAGLRDSVKDNKTGVVIGRNTPQEMAAQALKLYHDKKRYKNYQEQCVLYAKNLTWKKVTEESEKLLQSLQKKSIKKQEAHKIHI